MKAMSEADRATETIILLEKRLVFLCLCVSLGDQVFLQIEFGIQRLCNILYIVHLYAYLA